MSTVTPNSGLIKAEANDFIDFETHFNPNWDKIDEQLAENQKKTGDVVSPYAYENLVVNGDWRPAIQAALNTGKDVIIPYGTFPIKSNSLSTFADGQTIFGVGFNSIISNETPNAEDHASGTNTINVLHKNVTIKNLAIYGDQMLPLSGGTIEKKGTGHNIRFGGTRSGYDWFASTGYALNDYMHVDNRMYKCTVVGTTGSTPPSHTTGTATDGTVTWEYVGDWLTKFYGRVENVLIKNGYNGVTVENGAAEVDIVNLTVFNNEHSVQIYNSSDVRVNGLTHKKEAFRSSAGYSQRGITIHSGSKNVTLNNVRLEENDTAGIYIRVEDGYKFINKRIQGNNIHIKGNGTDPYGGVYFANGSVAGGIDGVSFTNLTFEKVLNAIVANGAEDAFGQMPTHVKNVSLSNITSQGCTNTLQHSGSGFTSYSPGFDGLKITNVQADSNITFKGKNSFAENANLTNGANISGTGLNYKNVTKDDVALGDNITHTTELKMGSGTGVNLKGMEVVTGTTPASGSSLTINYPTGYTKDNTQVLSFVINNTNNVGVGIQNQVEASITFGASTITLGFPASSTLYSCAYRVVLVRT